MTKDNESTQARPALAVDVVEAGVDARKGRLRCELGTNITFNLVDLQSYFFAEWNPTAYDALLVAAQAEPAIPRPSNPYPEDPPLGAHVRIRADDYGRDPVEGELVLIDTDEIALSRRDPQVGNVVVHFPRLGYDLRAM